MNQKYTTNKAITSYLEISIMIISLFAFSYMVSENLSVVEEILNDAKENENINGEIVMNQVIEKSLENEKQKQEEIIEGCIKDIESKKESFFEKILKKIIEKIKKPMVQSVSAQNTEPQRCCEEDINNVFCQDYDDSIIQKNCKSGIAPVSCDNHPNCKKGCCYSEETGLCSVSREINCNGNFDSSDITCSAVKCQKGCCILGSSFQFTTSKNCEVEALMLGLIPNFDSSINSEGECLNFVNAEKQGACVLGENCRLVTGAECQNLGGSFNPGLLCSNPDLNTNCEGKSYTGCVDGKDGVYWFDSCGNIENIYGTKNENGLIKGKDDSCDLKDDLNNAKTCGNCNYLRGSVCGLYTSKDVKPNQGDYVCKDLSCEVEIDGKNVIKENGESWCVYDGAIGVGETDNTKNSEIARDSVGSRHWRHVCIDGEEIVEPCADYRNEVCSEDEDEETGKTYSSCRINNWQECLSLNQDKAGIQECAEKTDCWVKKVAIDKFRFNVCVPRYPEGFDVFDDYSQEDAKDICNIGTQTCTVVYVEDWDGDCEVAVNKNCLGAGFTTRMNEVCTSLGDCGGYVNYIGDYSDKGYRVKWSKKGAGVANLAKKYIDLYKTFANPLGFANQKVDSGDLTSAPEYMGVLGGGVGSANAPGPGIGHHIVAGIAGVTSYVVGSALLYYGLIPVDPITAGIVIIIAIASYFGFLGGDVCKKVYVTYECKPWQPPAGGGNCEKCNEDPFKPCSKYRCQSLGAGCELINIGSEDEKCVWKNPSDNTPPKISPWFEAVSDGQSYVEASDKGFKIKTKSLSCIREFTKISLGITTDERAQCRFSLEKSKSFDNMEEDLTGVYSYNHSIEFSLPSVDSLAVLYNISSQKVAEVYGDFNFYIKCRDVNGKVNSADYTVNTCVQKGPDRTAPYVTQTLPETGNYIGYGETNQELNIWVNEPSNCSWSKTDTGYNNMENKMSCENDIEAQNLLGYNCNTILTGLREGENKIYIRCKDQPWYSARDTLRNTMTESYVYSVKSSNSRLKIDEIKVINPLTNAGGNEFLTAGSFMTLDLEAKTSGGAENGKAICEYNYFGDYWIGFENTNSNKHKQTGIQLFSGKQTIPIKCTDIAGNTAEDSTSFTISIDNQGPAIARMYYDYGDLKIITTEPGTCKYSLNENLIWEDKISMHGTGNEFTANWLDKTYYIECKDIFGNIGGSIIVRPYENL